MGRDLKHLVTTVDELSARGVGLRVLAGAGAEIDTTTANGRLVFGIFAALAEFERELIAERTRAGLAAARARGRLGGRPRKMDVAMLRMAIRAMASRDTNAQDLTRRLGITTTTLYMYVNGDGTVKAPGQKLLEAQKAQRQPGPLTSSARGGAGGNFGLHHQSQPPSQDQWNCQRNQDPAEYDSVCPPAIHYHPQPDEEKHQGRRFSLTVPVPC